MSPLSTGLERREVLQAAAAMLGLGACFRQPDERLMPYARGQPAGTPGVPLHYTTGLSLGGVTLGLVAELREHHPVKLEGNPKHPGSLGATGPIEQASLLDLYDPTRARAVKRRGAETSRLALVSALAALARRADQGRGLRFLVERTGSPTVIDAYTRVQERFPLARIVPVPPVLGADDELGAELAFGRRQTIIRRFDRARVIIAIADDPLAPLPQTLRSARDIVQARDPQRMSRIYAAECNLSLTGAFADHRLRVAPSRFEVLLRALANGLSPLRPELASIELRGTLSELERRWVSAAVADLLAHRGESIVTVGPRHGAPLVALGHLINETLGTLEELAPPLLEPPASPSALRGLVEEMRAGQVDALVITAWNPAVSVFADLDFTGALGQVKTSVYSSLHEDETAAQATWLAPAQHAFEAWRDGRAFEGTASIMQPLLAPLFDATFDEWALLAPFLQDAEASAYHAIRRHWEARRADFDTALAEGIVAGSAPPRARGAVRAPQIIQALRAAPAHPGGLEVHFDVDYKVYDGRYAHNAWLQELPHPMTQLSWGGAALMSPKTARAQGLKSGQRAALEHRGRSLETPLLILPGHADGAVTVLLGYGGALLRSSEAPGGAPGLVLAPLPESARLAVAQQHLGQEGRALALQAPAQSFAAHSLDPLRGALPAQFQPREPQGEYRWAMAIDLHRCIGCGTCVLACQAENNIPAVGPEQVRLGRELHWLRVDRYFIGDADEPEVITQPVACVHCEKAPCEYVCPVNATVHSSEGLNEMVYNRCIGTRYCSNNCPYKVRRFNYLNYSGRAHELQTSSRNPDVSVRPRGVMEKCTYCVQRIERGRIEAHLEDRRIRDGEVRTACQQACPTEAITFGDLSTPDSAVARAHDDPRHYELLHELGTRPRTVHLVRLKYPSGAGP